LLSFALSKARLQPIAVTNASIGKHVLKASIEPVAEEDDTADNTMTVEVEVKGAFQTMIVAPRIALHEEHPHFHRINEVSENSEHNRTSQINVNTTA